MYELVRSYEFWMFAVIATTCIAVLNALPNYAWMPPVKIALIIIAFIAFGKNMVDAIAAAGFWGLALNLALGTIAILIGFAILARASRPSGSGLSPAS